jgi:hypothetical protein
VTQGSFSKETLPESREPHTSLPRVVRLASNPSKDVATTVQQDLIGGIKIPLVSGRNLLALDSYALRVGCDVTLTLVWPHHHHVDRVGESELLVSKVPGHECPRHELRGALKCCVAM